MAITSKLTRAVLAAGLATSQMAIAAPAQAAETFVCDDGRVLTLTQDEVAVLVRTDPCIAKYFGREIVAPPPAAPVAAVPLDLPLPERKPQDIASKLRALEIDPTAPGAQRKPVAIADVPSDFRNVHIINGGSAAAPQYYQHTR
ncbi:MAG: hypothetical protein K0U74_09240 [Alphaproteobacteria bacterium]|nr:hypothetical protein [Alphaproteobacteria bacterium]